MYICIYVRYSNEEKYNLRLFYALLYSLVQYDS